MSPKTTSTALALIFALSAAPVLAQTTTEAPPADAPADAASDAAAAAASAADQAADAAEGAAEATGENAEAAADAAAAAASDAAAAAENAADAVADAVTDSAEPAEEEASEAAPTEEEAPAETAPAAEEATAEGATEAESEEPPVGAYYPRTTHGDWTLRCIRTADGADPCELYQLMTDGQGNSVAEITLIPLSNGGQAVAGATIVTPLETDLTQGLRLQIDSGAANVYPFNFCAPVGCVARLGLTSGELNSLKRGNAATVSLLPYGASADQVVGLTMSLTGFTAGYAELETAVAEMREAAAAAEAAAPAETPAATPAEGATDAPAEPASEEAAPAQ
ncbi:invasion associated locus B family protein [Paracoccus albus]|uniref:invasion associated locus B family protein n=1 Tax=Paracoccus albus TaxID=3017784 RepID=UPI0022F05EF2|nr:invasion associated locus B family protein [Paracoccus albus]WBU61555.1 invasion associated locus B family protein [Paracoccus albus]